MQVNLTNFHPHSLAVLLWALGRASKQLTPTLRVQAQAAVAALLPPSQAAGPGPRMHAWQRAFNPRELGLVVWAFAELRMQPSIKLQKALLARIEVRLTSLTLYDISPCAFFYQRSLYASQFFQPKLYVMACLRHCVCNRQGQGLTHACAAADLTHVGKCSCTCTQRLHPTGKVSKLAAACCIWLVLLPL